MTTDTTLLRRARLYESLRTAHLERAHALPPATLLYSVTRYDFDQALAQGLSLVRCSPVGAARLLLRSDVDELEINEPLMLSSLPATVLAVLALGLRDLVRRRRTLIVTYAIGNTDPFAQAIGSRLRSRVRRLGERMAARLVWRRVDRIAYGTEAARRVYHEVLPHRRGMAERVIPALPPPCQCHRPPMPGTRSQHLVFLGALSERKGFPTLADAWPSVADSLPGARLTVLGKGPLSDRARALAAVHPSVTFFEDPDRHVIHRELRSADVAVLASRSSPTWREQVGLPIVEALGHGCRIVTTTETGLAGWLADHGHTVVGPDYDEMLLAAALRTALLTQDPDRSTVLATLPSQDGRLLADDYLFSSGPP